MPSCRHNPNIGVEVRLQLGDDDWHYRLEFAQDNQRRPLVKLEKVLLNGRELLRRPIKEDEEDPNRLTQTHLEQVNANKEFRAVSEFLSQVRYIPSMMAGARRKSRRQILLSSHSADLLSDDGIGPEEVLLLEPTADGTVVSLAAEDREIRALLEGGLRMGEIVVPRSAPQTVEQLPLFGASDD